MACNHVGVQIGSRLGVTIGEVWDNPWCAGVGEFEEATLEGGGRSPPLGLSPSNSTCPPHQGLTQTPCPQYQHSVPSIKNILSPCISNLFMSAHILDSYARTYTRKLPLYSCSTSSIVNILDVPPICFYFIFVKITGCLFKHFTIT